MLPPLCHAPWDTRDGSATLPERLATESNYYWRQSSAAPLSNSTPCYSPSPVLLQLQAPSFAEILAHRRTLADAANAPTTSGTTPPSALPAQPPPARQTAHQAKENPGAPRMPWRWPRGGRGRARVRRGNAPDAIQVPVFRSGRPDRPLTHGREAQA